MRIISALLCGCLVAGCSTGFVRPKSLAEGDAGYTYIPMDPQSIDFVVVCKADPASLDRDPNLSDLPDNAVRIGIQSNQSDGKIQFGVGSATGQRGIYKVTVDYANTDTVSIPFQISRFDEDGKELDFNRIDLKNDKHNEKYQYTAERDFNLENESINARKYKDPREFEAYQKASSGLKANQKIFHIPVFVGVGVRIVADVVTHKSGINITGLGAIGGEASTNGLTGTMIAQTIGINGEKVAAAIPIQSTLDSTSVENALVAIGSVKTLLYDEDTVKSPRVLGIYLPLKADRQLINNIVSEISRRPISWLVGCNKARH